MLQGFGVVFVGFVVGDVDFDELVFGEQVYGLGGSQYWCLVEVGVGDGEDLLFVEVLGLCGGVDLVGCFLGEQGFVVVDCVDVGQVFVQVGFEGFGVELYQLCSLMVVRWCMIWVMVLECIVLQRLVVFCFLVRVVFFVQFMLCDRCSLILGISNLLVVVWIRQLNCRCSCYLCIWLMLVDVMMVWLLILCVVLSMIWVWLGLLMICIGVCLI